MDSPIKAAAKDAKVRTCIALVNKPRNIMGIGANENTKETRTTTSNSSANIFLKN